MGYAGMKGTMLQEKMAAGLHNRSLAMAGANSAVRAGESFLFNLIDSTNSVQAQGTPSGALYNLYSQLSDPNDSTSAINPIVELFKQRNWTSTAGTAHGNNFTTSSYNGALSQQPEYLIEELQYDVDNGGSDDFEKEGGPDNSDTQKVFLVTGKSASGDGRTIVTVQSMFTAVISSSSSN